MENIRLKEQLGKAREEIQRLWRIIHVYEPGMSKTKPFPFMQLPPEIRRMIWRCCLPPQRTLYVPHRAAADYIWCDQHHPFLRLPPPMITRVCSESRSVAFETGGFEMGIFHSYDDAAPVDLADVCPWDLSWFDHANDVLHLDDSVVARIMNGSIPDSPDGPAIPYPPAPYAWLKRLQQKVEQVSFSLDSITRGNVFEFLELSTWPRLRKVYGISHTPTGIHTLPRSNIDCALFGHGIEQSDWVILEEGDRERMKRLLSSYDEDEVDDALERTQLSDGLGHGLDVDQSRIESAWFQHFVESKKEACSMLLSQVNNQVMYGRLPWSEAKEKYSSLIQETLREMPNVVAAVTFRKCKL